MLLIIIICIIYIIYNIYNTRIHEEFYNVTGIKTPIVLSNYYNSTETCNPLLYDVEDDAFRLVVGDKPPNLNRLKSPPVNYDTSKSSDCIDRTLFDAKDISGKPLRPSARDYSGCFITISGFGSRAKAVTQITAFATIKEFQIYNDNAFSINPNPNKACLLEFLGIYNAWATKNAILGNVKEVMGMPRLTFGLLIRSFSKTYALYKPKIDYYKQQNDTTIIQYDSNIQEWFRKLIKRMTQLWCEHVKKPQGPMCDAEFKTKGKNNVDIFFIQGMLLLCILSNIDFSETFDDFNEIINKDIILVTSVIRNQSSFKALSGQELNNYKDMEFAFVPAELRGDKTIDYLNYMMTPILDTYILYNLYHNLKPPANILKKIDGVINLLSNANREFIQRYIINEMDKKEEREEDKIKEETNTVKRNKMLQTHIAKKHKLVKANGDIDAIKFPVETNKINTFKNLQERVKTTDMSIFTGYFKNFIYMKNNPDFPIAWKLTSFTSINEVGGSITLPPKENFTNYDSHFLEDDLIYNIINNKKFTYSPY